MRGRGCCGGMGTRASNEHAHARRSSRALFGMGYWSGKQVGAAMQYERLVRVRHLHGLYHDTIAAAGLIGRLQNTGADDAELFGRIFPGVFVEAVCARSSLSRWTF